MHNLRAHHLICFQQFQGMGYNEEFTKNMTEIIDSLKADSTAKVTVLDNMDDICAKCPNKITDSICKLATPTKNSSDKDRRVIEALQLTCKESYSFRSIIDKIEDNIDLVYDVCCKGCGWEKQGVCNKKCLIDGLNKFK